MRTKRKKKRARSLSGKLALTTMAMLLAMWLAVGTVLVVSTAREIIDGGYEKATSLVNDYRYDSYLRAYTPAQEDDWWIQHALEGYNRFLTPVMNSGLPTRYLQYNFTWVDDEEENHVLLPVHTLIGIRLQSKEEAPMGMFLLLDELSAADLAQISRQIRVHCPPLSATGTRNGLLFKVDTITIGDRTYSTGRTGGTDTVSVGEKTSLGSPEPYTISPRAARSEQDWELLLGAQDWLFSDYDDQRAPWQDYISRYFSYASVIYMDGPDEPEVWVGVVLAATPLRTALQEHMGTLLILLALVPVLGFLFSAIIHNMVVLPIRQTQKDFQKVAALDFGGLEGDTNRLDELGDLNRSLRQMADTLQNRWDDERALERRRQDFVSAASHELKTPLALMRGYTEGLEQGIGDREEYLAGMEREIQRMNTLVMEMLDQTKLERIDDLSSLDAIDLSQLVNRQLEQLAPLFAALHVTVQIKQGLLIPGDRPLLEQAVGNLLTNAAKFCRPGGCVCVTLKAGEHGPVLTIDNDADPIPAHQLPRLFEPFFRGDQARDRSGSGLGLSIARRIFQLHHLDCQIQNTDTGIRVRVLPISIRE
ncbi:HAMP domain-containing sensor histidine kinase [Flavonifractor sp. An100]|uniref:sensor histidine kinase n=1 Tax=Flavonifractor sp. An100 TaxID=1965538 RepID=UPI000B3A5318|nr:HAMP domain-containing sensor histidine kinase [Flavonifractor sp. An100]OUQ80664.1 hypothetical protein B5E43_03970 [Flavonifractor sp. An100]